MVTDSQLTYQRTKEITINVHPSANAMGYVIRIADLAEIHQRYHCVDFFFFPETSVMRSVIKTVEYQSPNNL